MDAIPVVDLRLLTQAEINALSRASSSSSSAGDLRRCDDIVIPKIDRAVFNESAGSRKQTYSRLRLAPRKPPDLPPSPSSSSAARGRRPAADLLAASSSSSAAPPPPPATADDPGRRENEQIVLFLRRLFAKNCVDIASAAAANDEVAAVPSGGVDANPNPVGAALGKRVREQEAAEAVNGDRELLNVNGVGADLVALAEKEDPFEPELKRRTQGLVTEEEFLRFLSGLEGQWASRRKRRRIVDADKFGDALPNGWKVLLALKRKEGNIWLHCRRYISPSGKQFISCKEVSSYLLSFVGSHDAKQQTVAQSSADQLGNGHAVHPSHQVNVANKGSSFSSATPVSAICIDSGKQTVFYRVENPAEPQLQDVLRCQDCNLTFADKGAHVQHLLTFHGSSRKKRRLGQSIGDGVIIRDGKYECQFCHKMFSERRRYNGHVGIHVKYLDRNLEPVTSGIIVEKNITSCTDGSASAFAEHSKPMDCQKKANLIEENEGTESMHVINDSYPHGNEHGGNTVNDRTLNFSDNEKEKIIVHEICTTGTIDEIKNSFPLSNCCDNDKERNVMQEICTLSNDQTSDSCLNNILTENRQNGDIRKCFDNGKNLMQALCNVQCIGEINDGFPLSNKQNKVNDADCFSKINNETSENGFVDSLPNDNGMTDQKPREAAETGSVMNGDICTCLDSTCPSLTDAGNCTSKGSPTNDLFNKISIDEMGRPSKLNIGYESNSVTILGGGQTHAEIVTSSGSVSNGIENSENQMPPDSDLNIFSGIKQSVAGNPIAICIEEDLVEMVKSGNKPKNDLACLNTTSDGAAVVKNIVHEKIQLSGNEERYLEDSTVPSGRKYCDIDTAIDDMLPSNGEEIMLEIMGQSSNELKDSLVSDDTVLDADAPRNDTGMTDEQNLLNLPVNKQGSWEQTSAHLPILGMISDQGDAHLHCINESREEISFFEDVRLGNIEAGKFIVSTGNESRGQPEDRMAVSRLENGPSRCVLPEWDPAYLNLGPRRRMTTVCVWCSIVFEQEDVDFELQPDSVGFMCPTCKARMPGAGLM